MYQYIPVCNGMYCARITFVSGMYTRILKPYTRQYIPQYVHQYVLQYGVVVLVCIQYIPVCSGMYCSRISFVFGMYTSILKLSTYQYVPQYVLQYGVVVLVCIQYIPARIGMYCGMYFACIMHFMI